MLTLSQGLAYLDRDREIYGLLKHRGGSGLNSGQNDVTQPCNPMPEQRMITILHVEHHQMSTVCRELSETKSGSSNSVCGCQLSQLSLFQLSFQLLLPNCCCGCECRWTDEAWGQEEI